MQQNRDINAFLKSGRCGGGYLREHFGSTTLRLLIEINTYWYVQYENSLYKVHTTWIILED